MASGFAGSRRGRRAGVLLLALGMVGAIHALAPPPAAAEPVGFAQAPGLTAQTTVEGSTPADYDPSITSGLERDPDAPAGPNTTITSGPQSTFIVTYNGFTAQQQASFQAAVDLWSGLLSSTVPITVDANFTSQSQCGATPNDFPTGVIGNAGPRGFFANFTNAPKPNVWYPAALANSYKGVDLDLAKPDICASFNSTFSAFYFGTDGNPPANQVDFMSVILHELGHGLGFVGSTKLTSTTQADLGFGGMPLTYDTLATRGDNTPLTSLPRPSTQLYDALTSGTDLYARGPAMSIIAGPTGARLHAPVPSPPSNPLGFIPGTSFSHLDETTYPCAGAPCVGDNTLMTPTIHFGEVAHMAGPLVIAMFRDMGWNLMLPATHYSVVATSPAVAGSPTSFVVTALDVLEGTDTNYAGTVHFASNAAAPFNLPANATLTAGVGTFNATFFKAGSPTITVTDTVKWLVTGTSNAIVVNAAPVAALTIEASSPAVVSLPLPVTVRAVDAFGNVNPNYAGTVHFTTTAPSSTLPADTTLTSGVGTFPATIDALGTFTVTATDTVNASLTATSSPIVFANGAGFHALPPVRILDTRSQLGIIGKVSGLPNNLTVVGVGGVPATNVSAVVMNITVTGGAANSFLTVFPAGATPPNASNLNFAANETIPNLVVVKVGAGGKVSFTNANASTDVVGDVVGYYDDGTITGDRYTAVPPNRILDTRLNTGIVGKVGATPKTLTVTGVGGVPASGVSAVVMNVTVTGATNNSFLTVFPTGTTPPNASNLNFAANQTIPNLVVVKVGAGGGVDIVNAVGTTDVVADVVGYFAPTGGGFTPLAPSRILDTRLNTGIAGKVGATPKTLTVTGVGGVPPTGVSAVVMNVTVTGSSANSFLTVFPNGTAPPNASNLNFAANQTIPNLVVVKVGAAGGVNIVNANGTTDVVGDVVGWYTT